MNLEASELLLLLPLALVWSAWTNERFRRDYLAEYGRPVCDNWATTWTWVVRLALVWPWFNLYLLVRRRRKNRRLEDQIRRPCSASDRPPKGPEYLLYIFLPRKQRDPLLGDLEEQYQEVLEKFGHRRAVLWYHVEVGKSLAPVVGGWLRRLVKWGVLAWIGERLHRWGGPPWLADLIRKIAP